MTTKAERDAIFNEWHEAYRKANGKEPPPIWKNGSWWYIGVLSLAYRLRQFPAMTERLLERVKDEPA